MQTIRIEVKDNYLPNVMSILKSMKDVMIDKIKLETPQQPNKHTIDALQALQIDSMSHTWDNPEDEAWDEL